MNVFNFLKNLLLVTALWTMVFEPVAFGLQSQAQFDRITQNQLKMMLIDLGLNKKMTYSQFWDRTKHLYPAQSYKEIEAYFKSQPSSVMPAFEVTYTQTPDGEKVPTLKVTDRGQTYNVQIIGELNEWARINQVSLSESDLMRLKPAIQKLDPTTTKLETYKKDFARFEGFPRMTPVLWKSMKPAERAEYIVKMRLLWFEARRVLESAPEAFFKSDSKQKTGKARKTSSYEEVLKLILGQEANAEVSTDVRAAVRKKISDRPRNYSAGERTNPTLKGSPCLPDSAVSGNGCIVAGVIAPPPNPDFKSSYTLTNNYNWPKTLVCGCDYNAVVEQRFKVAAFSGNERVSKLIAAQEKLDKACSEDPALVAKKSSIPYADKGSWVACQTDIYSYSPDTGKPYCVHSMSDTFQRATAWNADTSTQKRKDPSLLNCDEQSRLSASGTDLTKLSEADRIAAIDKEQRGGKGDYLLTQAYLNGMLKANDKNTTMAKLLDKDSVYDKDMDQFLVDTQKAFEKEIGHAMATCTDKSIGTNQEKNFGDACTQLHHRWLFTEKFIGQYRQKACLDKSQYVGLEGVVSRGKVQPAKALINTVDTDTIKTLNVCQCLEPSTKTVKMGEQCNLEPGVVLLTCPQDSTLVPQPPAPAGRGDDRSAGGDVKNICKCSNVNKTFELGKNEKENLDHFAKACGVPVIVRPPAPPPPEPPPPAKKSCDYPGASPLNDDCICTDGSLSGKPPVRVNKGTAGGEGGSTYSKDEWTCDQSSFNPLWLLAGLLAFLGLKNVFKKDDKPPQCAGLNRQWNNSQCVCKFTLICKTGANSDCTGCAAEPTCDPLKMGAVYPACECPNVKTCIAPNWALQGTTCKCDPIEGGLKPDVPCTESSCGGGVFIPPTGR